MANDQFAQIAADGIGGRMNLLEIPQLRAYQVKKCVLNDGAEGTMCALPTREKISTKHSGDMSREF